MSNLSVALLLQHAKNGMCTCILSNVLCKKCFLYGNAWHENVPHAFSSSDSSDASDLKSQCALCAISSSIVAKSFAQAHLHHIFYAHRSHDQDSRKF